ncbi:hypothetical protein QUA42_02615 [Microcoleus sp. Pol11C2]|uniref:hypothetical protein n=1 Tax=Microcoleus sp. Pol11C2 TaxID=3055389 RepID=UPI002FD320BA
MWPTISIGESEDFTLDFLSDESVKLANSLIENHGKSPDEVFEICRQSGIQLYNEKFYETIAKSQGLLLLWLNMGRLADEAESRTLTKLEAITEWTEHWEKAIPILGQVDLAAPELRVWFRRLKGITMLALGKLAKSLSESAVMGFLSVLEARRSTLSLGETTLEIGLAYGHSNIIYAGKSLMIYKGNDEDNSTQGRGELMIAVKHSSGCWSHYPSPENVRIPLSDYKKAKAELKKIPIALRGELIHFESEKLAKLLGLTVKGKYAYLIN